MGEEHGEHLPSMETGCARTLVDALRAEELSDVCSLGPAAIWFSTEHASFWLIGIPQTKYRQTLFFIFVSVLSLLALEMSAGVGGVHIRM